VNEKFGSHEERMSMIKALRSSEPHGLPRALAVRAAQPTDLLMLSGPNCCTCGKLRANRLIDGCGRLIGISSYGRLISSGRAIELVLGSASTAPVGSEGLTACPLIGVAI
jgi:hypothetical protein